MTTNNTGFVESSSQASRGGFQGIKKVTGLMTKIEKVPPKFTDSDFGEPKEQIEVVLEDAKIIEMFPGEEEFELKDNKFVFWVTYAEKGKTPHANSAYIKGFVASAEALGKRPSEFLGSVVTFEKKQIVLFKKPKLGADKKPLTDPDGKKIYEEVGSNVFCFVGTESATSGDTKTYVAELLVGLNTKAALRKLMTDPRAKQFPEYKAMLNDGKLAEFLGMTLVEDKFTKVGG